MAGIIQALFGGKSRPPDPEPLPGQGGYAYPRGPYGETGFPGSAPGAVPTKGQGPGDIQHQEETVTGNQEEWDNLPPGNWMGRAAWRIPTDRRGHRDTESRTDPDISSGIPGNERQRNTRYYGGRRAAPDNTNRYVYNGVNGGYESYSFERVMPYPRGFRGAQLEGLRYYADADQFTTQGGSYGIAREQGPNHRPTTFAEPAPWTTNYYDTTDSVGTADSPGSGGQSPNAVYVSPEVPRQTYRRGG
ncbi:MAG: hypothetical protein ACREHG_10860 [Candidatus Saccharimonadales bacterium]